MSKVTVDSKQCIMCNLCIDIAPEVFEEKRNKSTVRVGVDFGDKAVMKNVMMAVEACPVQAIRAG